MKIKSQVCTLSSPARFVMPALEAGHPADRYSFLS